MSQIVPKPVALPDRDFRRGRRHAPIGAGAGAPDGRIWIGLLLVIAIPSSA